MANKIFRGVRSRDGVGIPLRGRDTRASTRLTHDEGPTQHRIKIAEYTAATHAAEVVGDKLIVYAIADLMDPGPSVSAAVRDRVRRENVQRAQIADINAKARALWPVSPQGRR